MDDEILIMFTDEVNDYLGIELICEKNCRDYEIIHL